MHPYTSLIAKLCTHLIYALLLSFLVNGKYFCCEYIRSYGAKR